MEHTPGPWEIVRDGDNYDKQLNEDFLCSICDTKQEFYICRVWEDAGEEREESEANARLIAAAPDMLAMLEELEWNIPGWSKADKCPCCGYLKFKGHTEDCKLGNLLKRIKEIK